MTRKQLYFAITVALLMWVTFVAALLYVGRARADVGRPSGAWRGSEETLARVLVAEADGSRSDWAALLWTLQHRLDRYGETPNRIMRYSRTLTSNAPRPRSIHLLSDGEASARGRQVAAAREHVADWIRGHVPDPCPDALDWHGRSDSRPGWFQPVDCGATLNSFGKVRGR